MRLQPDGVKEFMNSSLSIHQLEFLANLPTVLNSSLQASRVITVTTQHLKRELGAEAATIFLLDKKSAQLTFWVLEGGGTEQLVGSRMPADKGIVGWVIQNQQPLIVNDVAKDQRFFDTVDAHSGFNTESVLCCPLTIRGRHRIGAIQVLNKINSDGFSDNDLLFLEQVCHQVALALSNAQLFEELQHVTQQLAVLNRRKDDTLTVISHEFRTPLNLLQNSIELFLSESISHEIRVELSRTMMEGLQRLTHAVAKIRDVSRVSTGSLSLQVTDVDVAELLQTLERESHEACTSRSMGWECAIECENGRELTVRADRILLLVALKNLVANAIRFTPDGGCVTISVRPRPGLCEFAIKDTGIGIDKSHLGLIFEKFYEVANVGHHKSGTYEFRSGGLGLGLPTAQAIVQAHGGSIAVQSAPNEGSTFSFSIPLSTETA